MSYPTLPKTKVRPNTADAAIDESQLQPKQPSSARAAGHRGNVNKDASLGKGLPSVVGSTSARSGSAAPKLAQRPPQSPRTNAPLPSLKGSINKEGNQTAAESSPTYQSNPPPLPPQIAKAIGFNTPPGTPLQRRSSSAGSDRSINLEERETAKAVKKLKTSKMARLPIAERSVPKPSSTSTASKVKSSYVSRTARPPADWHAPVTSSAVAIKQAESATEVDTPKEDEAIESVPYTRKPLHKHSEYHPWGPTKEERNRQLFQYHAPAHPSLIKLEAAVQTLKMHLIAKRRQRSDATMAGRADQDLDGMDDDGDDEVEAAMQQFIRLLPDNFNELRRPKKDDNDQMLGGSVGVSVKHNNVEKKRFKRLLHGGRDPVTGKPRVRRYRLNLATPDDPFSVAAPSSGEEAEHAPSPAEDEASARAIPDGSRLGTAATTTAGGRARRRLEAATIDLTALSKDPTALAVVRAFVEAAPHVQTVIIHQGSGTSHPSGGHWGVDFDGKKGPRKEANTGSGSDSDGSATRSGGSHGSLSDDASVSDTAAARPSSPSTGPKFSSVDQRSNTFKNIFAALSRNVRVTNVVGLPADIREPFRLLMERNEEIRNVQKEHAIAKVRESQIEEVKGQILQERLVRKRQLYDTWRNRIQLGDQQAKAMSKLQRQEQREWETIELLAATSASEAAETNYRRQEWYGRESAILIDSTAKVFATVRADEEEAFLGIRAEEYQLRLAILSQVRKAKKDADSEWHLFNTSQYEQRKQIAKEEVEAGRRINDSMRPAIESWRQRKAQLDRERKDEQRKAAEVREAAQLQKVQMERDRINLNIEEAERRGIFETEVRRVFDFTIRVMEDEARQAAAIQRAREAEERRVDDFYVSDAKVPRVGIKLDTPMLQRYTSNTLADLLFLAPNANVTTRIDQPKALEDTHKRRKMEIMGGFISVEITSGAHAFGAALTAQQRQLQQIQSRSSLTGGPPQDTMSPSASIPIVPCEGVMLYIPSCAAAAQKDLGKARKSDAATIGVANTIHQTATPPPMQQASNSLSISHINGIEQNFEDRDPFGVCVASAVGQRTRHVTNSSAGIGASSMPVDPLPTLMMDQSTATLTNTTSVTMSAAAQRTSLKSSTYGGPTTARARGKSMRADSKPLTAVHSQTPTLINEPIPSLIPKPPSTNATASAAATPTPFTAINPSAIVFIEDDQIAMDNFVPRAEGTVAAAGMIGSAVSIASNQANGIGSPDANRQMGFSRRNTSAQLKASSPNASMSNQPTLFTSIANNNNNVSTATAAPPAAAMDSYDDVLTDDRIFGLLELKGKKAAIATFPFPPTIGTSASASYAASADDAGLVSTPRGGATSSIAPIEGVPKFAPASSPQPPRQIVWNGIEVGTIVKGYAGPRTRAAALQQVLVDDAIAAERSRASDRRDTGPIQLVSPRGFARDVSFEAEPSFSPVVPVAVVSSPTKRDLPTSTRTPAVVAIHTGPDGEEEMMSPAPTPRTRVKKLPTAGGRLPRSMSNLGGTKRLQSQAIPSTYPLSPEAAVEKRVEVLRIDINPHTPRSAISDMLSHLAYFNATGEAPNAAAVLGAVALGQAAISNSNNNTSAFGFGSSVSMTNSPTGNFAPSPTSGPSNGTHQFTIITPSGPAIVSITVALKFRATSGLPPAADMVYLKKIAAAASRQQRAGGATPSDPPQTPPPLQADALQLREGHHTGQLVFASRTAMCGVVMENASFGLGSAFSNKLFAASSEPATWGQPTVCDGFGRGAFTDAYLEEAAPMLLLPNLSLNFNAILARSVLPGGSLAPHLNKPPPTAVSSSVLSTSPEKDHSEDNTFLTSIESAPLSRRQSQKGGNPLSHSSATSSGQLHQVAMTAVAASSGSAFRRMPLSLTNVDADAFTLKYNSLSAARTGGAGGAASRSIANANNQKDSNLLSSHSMNFGSASPSQSVAFGASAPSFEPTVPTTASTEGPLVAMLAELHNAWNTITTPNMSALYQSAVTAAGGMTYPLNGSGEANTSTSNTSIVGGSPTMGSEDTSTFAPASGPGITTAAPSGTTSSSNLHFLSDFSHPPSHSAFASLVAVSNNSANSHTRCLWTMNDSVAYSIQQRLTQLREQNQKEQQQLLAAQQLQEGGMVNALPTVLASASTAPGNNLLTATDPSLNGSTVSAYKASPASPHATPSQPTSAPPPSGKHRRASVVVVPNPAVTVNSSIPPSSATSTTGLTNSAAPSATSIAIASASALLQALQPPPALPQALDVIAGRLKVMIAVQNSDTYDVFVIRKKEMDANRNPTSAATSNVSAALAPTVAAQALFAPPLEGPLPLCMPPPPPAKVDAATLLASLNNIITLGPWREHTTIPSGGSAASYAAFLAQNQHAMPLPDLTTSATTNTSSQSPSLATAQLHSRRQCLTQFELVEANANPTANVSISTGKKLVRDIFYKGAAVATIEGGRVMTDDEYWAMRRILTAAPIDFAQRDHRGRCITEAVSTYIRPYEPIFITMLPACTMGIFATVLNSFYYASMTRDPDQGERVIDIGIIEGPSVATVLRRTLCVEPVDDPTVIDLLPSRAVLGLGPVTEEALPNTREGVLLGGTMVAIPPTERQLIANPYIGLTLGKHSPYVPTHHNSNAYIAAAAAATIAAPNNIVATMSASPKGSPSQQQQPIMAIDTAARGSVYRIPAECRPELAKYLPEEKIFYVCPNAMVMDPDTVEFTGGWVEIEITSGAEDGDCLYFGIPPPYHVEPTTFAAAAARRQSFATAASPASRRSSSAFAAIRSGSAGMGAEHRTSEDTTITCISDLEGKARLRPGRLVPYSYHSWDGNLLLAALKQTGGGGRGGNNQRKGESAREVPLNSPPDSQQEIITVGGAGRAALNSRSGPRSVGFAETVPSSPQQQTPSVRNPFLDPLGSKPSNSLPTLSGAIPLRRCSVQGSTFHHHLKPRRRSSSANTTSVGASTSLFIGVMPIISRRAPSSVRFGNTMPQQFDLTSAINDEAANNKVVTSHSATSEKEFLSEVTVVEGLVLPAPPALITRKDMSKAKHMRSQMLLASSQRGGFGGPHTPMAISLSKDDPLAETAAAGATTGTSTPSMRSPLAATASMSDQGLHLPKQLLASTKLRIEFGECTTATVQQLLRCVAFRPCGAVPASGANGTPTSGVGLRVIEVRATLGDPTEPRYRKFDPLRPVTGHTVVQVAEPLAIVNAASQTISYREGCGPQALPGLALIDDRAAYSLTAGAAAPPTPSIGGMSAAVSPGTLAMQRLVPSSISGYASPTDSPIQGSQPIPFSSSPPTSSSGKSLSDIVASLVATTTLANAYIAGTANTDYRPFNKGYLHATIIRGATDDDRLYIKAQDPSVYEHGLTAIDADVMHPALDPPAPGTALASLMSAMMAAPTPSTATSQSLRSPQSTRSTKGDAANGQGIAQSSVAQDPKCTRPPPALLQKVRRVMTRGALMKVGGVGGLLAGGTSAGMSNAAANSTPSSNGITVTSALQYQQKLLQQQLPSPRDGSLSAAGYVAPLRPTDLSMAASGATTTLNTPSAMSLYGRTPESATANADHLAPTLSPQQLQQLQKAVPNPNMYKFQELYNSKKSLIGAATSTPTEVFVGFREGDKRLPGAPSGAGRGAAGGASSPLTTNGPDYYSNPSNFPATSLSREVFPPLSCYLRGGTTPLSRHDVQSVLKSLVYENRSSNPTELRKLVLVSLCDEVSTTHILLEIFVQPVDDVTEIRRPAPAASGPLVFRNGFSGAYFPLLEGCYLEDPDTDFFNSGYLMAQITNGMLEGDGMRLLSLAEQRILNKRLLEKWASEAATRKEKRKEERLAAIAAAPASASSGKPEGDSSRPSTKLSITDKLSRASSASVKAPLPPKRSGAAGAPASARPRPSEAPPSPPQGPFNEASSAAFSNFDDGTREESIAVEEEEEEEEVPSFYNPYEFVYLPETREVFLLLKEGSASPEGPNLAPNSIHGTDDGDDVARQLAGPGQGPLTDDFEQTYATNTFANLQVATSQANFDDGGGLFGADLSDEEGGHAPDEVKEESKHASEEELTAASHSLSPGSPDLAGRHGRRSGKGRAKGYYTHPEGRLRKVGVVVFNVTKPTAAASPAVPPPALGMSPAPATADPGNSTTTRDSTLAATLSFAPPDALDATYRHTPLAGGVKKSISAAMAKRESKATGSPLAAASSPTVASPPSTVSILIKLSPWLREEDRDHHHTADPDRCPHACPVSTDILSALMRSIAFVSSDAPPRTKAGPRTFLIRVSPGGNAVEGRCKIATSVLPSILAVANAIAPAKRDLMLLATSGAVSESTNIPYDPQSQGQYLGTTEGAISSGNMGPEEDLSQPTESIAPSASNAMQLQPSLLQNSPSYAAVVAKGAVFPLKTLVPIGDVSLRKGFARIEISSTTFNPLTDEIRLIELGKSFHVRPPHKLFTANGMYCGTLTPIYHQGGPSTFAPRASVAAPVDNSSAGSDPHSSQQTVSAPLANNPIRGYLMTFDSNCRATTHILQALLRSMQYTCSNPLAVCPNGNNWRRAMAGNSSSTAPTPTAKHIIAPSPPPSFGLLGGGIGRRTSLAAALTPLAPPIQITPNTSPALPSAQPIIVGRISRASSMAAITTEALLGAATAAGPQHEGVDEFGAVRPNMGVRVFSCVLVDGPNAATEVTKVEVKVFMPNASDFNDAVSQSIAIHTSASRPSGFLMAQLSSTGPTGTPRRSKSEDPATPIKTEGSTVVTKASTGTNTTAETEGRQVGAKRQSTGPAPPTAPKSLSARNTSKSLSLAPKTKKAELPTAPFIIRSTTTTSVGRAQSPNSHNSSFRSPSRSIKSPDSSRSHKEGTHPLSDEKPPQSPPPPPHNPSASEEVIEVPLAESAFAAPPSLIEPNGAEEEQQPISAAEPEGVNEDAEAAPEDLEATTQEEPTEEDIPSRRSNPDTKEAAPHSYEDRSTASDIGEPTEIHPAAEVAEAGTVPNEGIAEHISSTPVIPSASANINGGSGMTDSVLGATAAPHVAAAVACAAAMVASAAAEEENQLNDEAEDPNVE